MRLLLHAGAAVWFGALAIVFSYPLVLGLDSHVPGAGAGDNLSFLWSAWWARFLADHGSLGRFFSTDRLFAPFGTSLVLHTHTALEAMVSGVALHALPIVRAHNLVLLAGLAGNGFAAYLLAWTFTRRAMPAVVAGTSFATCSYLSVHLLGHVNLTHAWVLPVACLAWNALLDSPGIVRALGTAVACAAAAYTDYYYAIYTGLFMVVWAAVTLRDPAVTWIRRRFRILAALVAGLGVLATIAAIVIRLSSGIVVSAGPIHISALHARNPTSIAGVCAIVWVPAPSPDPGTAIG